MSRFYVRRSAEPRETLAAGVAAMVLGAGVGVTAYYLIRLFLAREPLPPLPTRRVDATAASEDGADREEAPG